MTLVFVFFTSLSILQIFYVTGVSVSWSSPSTIYSSIRSQSVPTYNGNLQQDSISSTIRPFRISEGTLSSQINNLTKMPSNTGLGQNADKILAKQVSQQEDNNDASVSENIITNIRPFEMSFDSSLSSTNIPNFEIPINFNGPKLSNIYHKTNKISDTNRLNEVNKLDESSGSDEDFQLGEFGRLSGSIIEEGLNLVNNNGGLNDKNKKGLRKENSGEIGENKSHREGNTLENYRRGHKSRKINLISGTGGSTEFSFEAKKGAKQGFIGEGKTKEFGELRRDGEGKMFIGNGEDKDEGKNSRFSASVGSIQFGGKNYSRTGGLNGGEGGDRGFSRSNGSIRFSRKNKSGTGGLGGEEERDTVVGRSNEFISFGSKIKSREGGSGGEEEEGRGFSGSVGSIRLGKKNMSGTGGSSEQERGDREFSRSSGSIRFDIKKSGRADGSDGEGGGVRFNRSNGPIRFIRKNKSKTDGLSGKEEARNIGTGRPSGSIRFDRESRSSGEDEEGRGFSGSVGYIRLDRKNMSETGGSGGENIKISEGQRAHKTSILRGIGKINGSGGMRNFGGSVGTITLGEESGNKELSKLNSININKIVGNNRGGRFDDIKGNRFSKEYGTDEKSDGGEFEPEMGEKLKWVD